MVNSMTRIFAFSFGLFAYVLLCHSALAAGFTKDELVGTYRVNSYSIIGHSLPTNYYAFAITLNANGSFVATNVPADLYFNSTSTVAIPEARGTWKLRHVSEGRSFIHTGETDYLDLDFTMPSHGSDSHIVLPGDLPRLAASYHSGESDSASFCLTKKE